MVDNTTLREMSRLDLANSRFSKRRAIVRSDIWNPFLTQCASPSRFIRVELMGRVFAIGGCFGCFPCCEACIMSVYNDLEKEKVLDLLRGCVVLSLSFSRRLEMS